MATPHPAITRIRAHIKAMATELQAAIKEDPDAPDHVKLFFSGLTVGMAAAIRVVDGDTAEKASEFVETQLYAAMGKALLDGKITAPPAAADLTKEG